jgi:amino acid adenylation domain-containing protein
MSAQECPTSFGQQRIWFLDQVASGTAAYNIARVFRLTGSLNAAALGQALRAIISRHETLRTVFVSREDEVKQIVLSAQEFNLLVSDISGLPQTQREQTALNIAREEASKLFDLSRGPLLRARLLRLDTDNHILVLVIHHIIADGWSMNLLFHEMGELYAGQLANKEPQLPQLSLQYCAYARWQRTSVAGDSLAEKLEYWKSKLRGAETVLQLPTDYPRPAVHSGRGKSIPFQLSAEKNRGLSALAKSEHATLFMALLSLFHILLGRYTLQDSILIGSPAAGRNHVELENLIGFFVNTLVMRADLDADVSFRQVLQQVRLNTLEALSHQDVPFEKLVEALDPDRNMNRNPLFQAMFVLHNAPKPKVELPGLLMQEVEFDSGLSKFDLTLEVIDLGHLHCTLEYDSDIFEESTIRRMAGHFEKLVDTVIAMPDENLSSFSLLTASEMQQFALWNNTKADYAKELPVHAAFEEQVTRTPEKTAVIDQTNRLSYRELNDLANRLARRLIANGVESGALVGVYVNRSLEMVIALLGILKVGAAYVPLDPAYPEWRLDFILKDSQVGVVATTPEFADLWPKYTVDTVVFNVDDLSMGFEDKTNLSLPLFAASRMYVIYTSGSTGTPKGVEGTHRACMNRFSWMWNAYPFTEGEICCQKTFLGFVDSIWEIFGPLLRGVPIVIIPDHVVIEPEHLIQLLSRHEVTRIVLVPSLLRVLLESIEDIQARLPHLALWTSSGEFLSTELAARFSQMLPKAKLLNIYGSSEVAADVTCHEVTKGERNRLIPIGRPIFNVEVFILDRHLNQVPVGVPGEIHIGGDCVAIGYLRKPELTDERFIVHRFASGDKIRLFKTGDLGRYLPNGEIEYLGRADNQVKIRGMRVELGEIEAVLSLHPAVRSAVVVLADPPEESRLTAYIEARSGLHPVAVELRHFLRSRLPEYMVPSNYLVVDAFSLLPSGKIDRKKLPVLTSARSLPNRGPVLPETSTEEHLANIWSNLLNIRNVGITDNFFDLGGHSLMAMQVIARIRKEFEVDIPISVLFEAPTIRGLAKEVERAIAEGIKPSAPISSFFQTSDAHEQVRQQIGQMSREELEELLRRVIKKGSDIPV